MSIQVLLSLLLTSVPARSAQPVLPVLPVQPVQDEAPPGMVLVKGGTITIGTKVKDVEAMGLESEGASFGAFVRETPQHTQRVDDFYLMVNEVTNEQYAAYVTVSGTRPPWTWGEKAANDARQEFLETQALAIKTAKDAGQPIPPRKKFDLASWWEKNWEGKEWEVPKGQEDRPVTYVTYQDARNYARWAGMRLMTEAEYQAAGRGRGDGIYPWGDDPLDRERAATQDSRISDPLPVGALPKGATESGLHHLVGNVWEWTSTPFSPYPKYKDLTIEIGSGKRKRTIPGMTQWDANQRVVVGGSFQNGPLVARLTTRLGTARNEATNALGFRCAASLTPGQDIAGVVLRDDVPPNTRPPGVEYDPTKTVATDRWTSEPGSAAVERYAVVSNYEYALFVPTIDVDAVSMKRLRDDSVKGLPIQMGVLSTTVPLIEPELAPGTYIVAFRGSSKPPEEPSATQGKVQGKDAQDPDAADAPPVVRVPAGYDWEQESFIFYRPDGEPVAALSTVNADIRYVRPTEPKITVVDTTRPVDTGEVDEDGEPIIIDEPIQVANFLVNTWVRVRGKAFAYQLRLVAAPGSFDGWRR